MSTMAGIRPTDIHRWSITVANLIPLWLLSIAIMAEGFPRPPISVQMAEAAFVLSVVICGVLLWKRWLPIKLLPFYLIPLFLLISFDEISTTYKTPFIIFCTVILSAGIVGFMQILSTRWRWLILLSSGALTLGLAGLAVNNFWDMVGALGYRECFPDAFGCPPLTGQETPWWQLFFSP